MHKMHFNFFTLSPKNSKMPNGRKRARTDGGAGVFSRSRSRLGKKGHRRIKKTPRHRRKAGRSKRGKRKRGFSSVRVAKKKGKAVLKRAKRSRGPLTSYKAIDVKTASFPYGRSHRMVTRDMNSYSRFPLLPTGLCETVTGAPVNPTFAIQPAFCYSFSNLSNYNDAMNGFCTGLCSPTISSLLGKTVCGTDSNYAVPEELFVMSRYFKKATVEAVHIDYDLVQTLPMWTNETQNPSREPGPIPGFFVYSYVPPMEVRMKVDSTLAISDQTNLFTDTILKDVECTQQSIYRFPPVYEDAQYYDSSAAGALLTSRGFRYDWVACQTPGLRIKYIQPTMDKDRLVRAKFSLDVSLREWYGYSKLEWEKYKQMSSGARMPYTNRMDSALNPCIQSLQTPDYATNVNLPKFAQNCVGYVGLIPDFAAAGARYTLGSALAPPADYDTLFFFEIKSVASRYIDLDEAIDQIPIF